MQAAHISGFGDAIASLLSVRAQLVALIKVMARRLYIIANQSQTCESLTIIPASACIMHAMLRDGTLFQA